MIPKNQNLIIACILMILTIWSCSEIFDKDISGERLIVLSPPSELETDLAQIEFWWEDIKGASFIELQIVRGDFKNIIRKQIDTVISTTSNDFSATLFPGTFEWRMRAGNNAGVTEYVYGIVVIDSSLNLSGVSPNLLFPNNQDTFSQTSVNLNWGDIYNADSYHVQVYKTDFGLNLVIEDFPINSTFNFSIPEEGGYRWDITAKNEMSTSITSSRTFFVDTTAPAPPTLNTPANNAVFPANNNISFTWTPDPNEVSSMQHELEVSSDSLFSSINFRLFANTPSIQTDTLSQGPYFWRVKSTDKAGNTGSFSNLRKLNIQ